MGTITPTYLMIKRHTETGLLYFCKTATRNPLTYHGSGSYWKRHIKMHGKKIETLWYHLFDDVTELTEFALFFSEFHNIVRGVGTNGKKIWANELPEDGLQGGQNRGLPSPLKGVPTNRISIWKNKRRPEHSLLMKGRTLSDEHKENISVALSRHVRTPEHGTNISIAKQGKKQSKKREHITVTCPQCGIAGAGPNMTRYHFDKCKYKGK